MRFRLKASRVAFAPSRPNTTWSWPTKDTPRKTRQACISGCLVTIRHHPR